MNAGQILDTHCKCYSLESSFKAILTSQKNKDATFCWSYDECSMSKTSVDFGDFQFNLNLSNNLKWEISPLIKFG